MPRKSYVQHPITLELIPADEYVRPYQGKVSVSGDLPDFVSPIDGKTYSGRAGLREHNRKHDVVVTADLKGLPSKPPTPTFDRGARRQDIADLVYGRRK